MTPSIGYPKIQYTNSVVNLAIWASQFKFVDDEDDQSINYLVKEGTGISSNREWLIRELLTRDATHALFIDEDCAFDPEAVHTLASRKEAIVGCNYPMKIPGAGFTALNKEQTARIQTTAESTGLEECAYMGFGLCLIRRDVMEEMVKDSPMFPLGWIPDQSQYTTEDSTFFFKARQKGFTPYVDQDASRLMVHMGNFGYSWMDEWAKPEPKPG